jgi:hypothetical protein
MNINIETSNLIVHLYIDANDAYRNFYVDSL